MAEAVAYEEQRWRQVEANKRKLEELQLHHLSAAVREAAAKPSPVCPVAVSCSGSMFLLAGFALSESALMQAKKRTARVPRDAAAEPLRRSGRVANLPEKPKYREREVSSTESYAGPKISSFPLPSHWRTNHRFTAVTPN